MSDTHSREELVVRTERALRSTAHILKARTRKNLEQFGLTLPRLWALVITKHHPGVTMSRLKDKLFISGGAITGLVEKLVEDGLVERRRDEKDRRIVRLELTGRGRELLEEVIAFRQGMVEAGCGSMETEELRRFVSDLEDLQRDLEQLPERQQE